MSKTQPSDSENPKKPNETEVKIGELVKMFVPDIFHYCDTVDHTELHRLMDDRYSKDTFDINYPFCKAIDLIPSEESKRYWTDSYVVRGKTVRCSSQWFDSRTSKSRQRFIKYLLAKKIVTKAKIASVPAKTVTSTSYRRETKSSQTQAKIGSRGNARYRGSAIGNSQNLLIRNILSNLGQEKFNEVDWEQTKNHFSNQCAYCSAEGKLVIDHATPINRTSLGEHRLGNLVPSCQSCNGRKAGADFRKFLGSDTDRIAKIETYMDTHNYVPLGDNQQVSNILQMAYRDVASLSNRYINILNELLPKESPIGEPDK